MKYNLLIVDDHKMFLDGLLSILNSENDYNIVLSSNDGSHVIKYLEINPDQKIDLIITDISMPKVDGVSLNKIIKEKNQHIKILVVSMHSNIEMIDDLIENNVDGYVPKNAEKKELLKAIQTILQGEKYFSNEIKEIYLQNKLSNKKKRILD